MGKGEIQFYDITFNFDKKLNEYLESKSGLSSDEDGHIIKSFINKLIDEVKTYIPLIATKASFQHERGNKTGNDHLQMRIKLIKPKVFSKNKNKGIIGFLSTGVLQGCHPTPTNQKSIDNNDWNYLMKEDTKVDNHYMFESNNWKMTDISGNVTTIKNIDFLPLKYSLDRINLVKSQQQIIEMALLETNINDLTVWNDRWLNFIADFKGNSKKTTLTGVIKYNDMKLNLIDLPCINDYKILMQDLYQQAALSGERNNFIVVMDFPRALNKDRIYGIYSALEKSKDGMYFDPRYDRKEYAINCPSIWIFSNQPPDLDCMTNDRWKLWEIDNDELLPLTVKEMKYKQMKYDYMQHNKKKQDLLDTEIMLKNMIIELKIIDESEIERLYKKYKIIYIKPTILDKFEKIKIIEKNKYCKCTIELINICKCKKPKYETITLTGNSYCINCHKWKCRC